MLQDVLLVAALGPVGKQADELADEVLGLDTSQERLDVGYHRRVLVEEVQACVYQLVVVQEQPVYDVLQDWRRDAAQFVRLARFMDIRPSARSAVRMTPRSIESSWLTKVW